MPRPEYYGAVPKAKATQVDDIFRQSLKELRLAKKLAQTQVAERLGQPQSYVSKYETGERRLDFVETVFVCETLGTSVEEFAAHGKVADGASIRRQTRAAPRLERVLSLARPFTPSNGPSSGPCIEIL